MSNTTEKSPLLSTPEMTNENETKNNVLTEAFGYFIQAMGWVPLVLSLAIGELQIAFTAACGVAAFNIFVLSFVWYKMGKTASWPKTLDIIFIVLFGILTILAWTLPENRDTIKYFANVIINGGLAVGVAVTWMAGHPFIRSYIEDNVGKEGSTYPVVKHMVTRLTSMWLVAFTVMALVSLPPAIMYVQGNPSTTAFTVCNIISYVILGCCLTVAFWLYPAYFEKHQEDIAKNYEEEIAEWEKLHPDHEFSQEDYKYEVNA